jgi:UDP-glucose 4-epimerase
MTLNVAVTGAQGFIGRHFCARLSSSGMGCVELSRESLVGGELERRLRGCDVVVHLAARAHVLRESASSPVAEYHAANVLLTQRVAGAAAAAGVRRLVFVSSAGVLGQVSPPGGFDDSHPPNPYDAYTRSKLEAEKSVLLAQATGLQTVIVRPTLVYGPGARGNFDRLLAAVRAGWPLPLGGIDARRSMIGVRNLTDLLLQASVCADAAGCTMLAADAEPVTVGEFIRAIAAAAQVKERVFSIPNPLLQFALALVGRRADVARLTQPFEIHAGEARQRLGWVPAYSMSDELAWTMRFPARRQEEI